MEKTLEGYTKMVSEDSYIFMTKNIKGDWCKYYNNNDELIVVYNKKEDWYIQFDKTLSSTNRTHSKGVVISLHTDINQIGYRQWEVSFLGYGEHEFNKKHKKRLINKDEFFRLFSNILGIKNENE